MSDNVEEKKTRKPKEERTDKEQAFMDAVHFFRKHPYKEAYAEIVKAALVFKKEKTGDETAEL